MQDIEVADAHALAARALSAHEHGQPGPLALGSWTLTRVAGGLNGIVWRAACEERAFAIKLSVLDERHRGWREYAATRRLHEAGLDIAPVPVVLVVRGALSVLVSSWRLGARLDQAPAVDSPLWSRIASTYAQLHAVEADSLAGAVQGASVESYLDAARTFALRAGRGRFLALLDEVRRRSRRLPEAPGRRLIHVDANLTNVLATEQRVILCDWEYSGGGDPCADIAELCTSPANLDIGDSARERLIGEHAAALGAPELAARTKGYLLALLAYWCARLEAPPPPTATLAGASARRRFDRSAQIDHYRSRLAAALDLDRKQLDLELAE